jgi:hypothetical protein
MYGIVARLTLGNSTTNRWPDGRSRGTLPVREAVPREYWDARDCELGCCWISSLQMQGRCNRWHLAQAGLSSSHLTLRLRQVRQPEHIVSYTDAVLAVFGGVWYQSGSVEPEP